MGPACTFRNAGTTRTGAKVRGYVHEDTVSRCPRCAFIVLLIKMKAPAPMYWHS